MATSRNKVEVQTRKGPLTMAESTYFKLTAMAASLAVNRHGVESAYESGHHREEELQKLLTHGTRSALQRYQRWNPQSK